MQQDNKYWAKNDMMLIGDSNVEQNPQDTFKQTYVA